MFNPKYSLTDRIVSMLMSIAESRSVIERAHILPASEVRLRRQALVRMTHSSTEIEGNILNIQQVEALMANKKVDAPERDIYEVENYLKALKYIETVVADRKPVTEKVLLKVHALVTQRTLPDDRSGHYRKGPIYVVRQGFGMPQEVVYTGPSAADIPALCADLLAWLDKSQKQDINPVLVAGILHQEIAAIHPFADGNGRTARAMATLVLYARGYDFRRLFALEDYYNRDRTSYYAAINIGANYGERRADFTPWLEYFVRGFREEIDAVRAQIAALSVGMGGGGERIFLEKDQLLILDFVSQMGRIAVSDVIDILGCPRRTAQSKLLRLKSLGIITQTGKGPSSAYVMTPSLRADSAD